MIFWYAQDTASAKRLQYQKSDCNTKNRIADDAITK